MRRRGGRGERERKVGDGEGREEGGRGWHIYISYSRSHYLLGLYPAKLLARVSG